MFILNSCPFPLLWKSIYSEEEEAIIKISGDSLDLSDLYKQVRDKKKRTVHVKYAGGWLLAPFIADRVKKISQAFKGSPGSVEVICKTDIIPYTQMMKLHLY